MRTLSLAASQQLAKQQGVEPIVLLQIEIPNAFVYVADKDVTRNSINWRGKIVTLGSITTEQRTDLVGSVASLQVTLDDSDGVYRARLNTERWQAQKVKIFHAFQDVNDTFLVFAGKISTPFSWNEDGHVINFEAVSDFTSQPSGIELVDDQFEGAVSGGGVPLAFGTIINSCPVQIYKNISAKVVVPFVKDTRLISISQATVIGSNPAHTWAESPFQAQYGNYLYYSNGFYIVDASEYSKTFEVDNANAFPQDTPISLSVSNFLGKVEGSFHGNVFTVTNVNDLLKTLQKGDIADQSHAGARPAYITVQGADLFNYQFTVLCFNVKNSFGEDQQIKINVIGFDPTTPQKLYLGDDPPETWSTIEVRVLPFIPDGNLVGPTQIVAVPIGAEVYLDDNGIIEAYAFTALPYTGLKVLGYQIFNGKKFLCELPSQFYSIIHNFKGLGIDAIAIPKKLSSYKITISNQNFDLTWGDSFYVSFQSSVGSNAADIIAYIFQTYTNFVIDPVSFALVRTLIDKYPLNFVVKGTPEVLSLISEICYQSRLGLTIKNGLVYLNYLSKEPATVAQITDNDIVENSFEQTYTEESKLKTQLTAKYEYDCIDHLPKKSVFKNNVTIYGLIKEEKNYYVTNNADLIQKSNTFWGYRISNQWKLLKFKTVLTTLAIEQGDCVHMQSEYYTGKAVVETYQYDSLASEVDISLWTPVVAGTNVPSPFAWFDDTLDVKPIALTISAAKPLTYTISLPVSNYGVHYRSAVTGNITGDEDGQTAPFVADDGTTGVATNLNDKAKVKAGDKVILVKDKFGNFTFQAPGGGDGGGTPVIINFAQDDGSCVISVYADGYAKAPTEDDVSAQMTNVLQGLITPFKATGLFLEGQWVIDVPPQTYEATVTSITAADGTFQATVIGANGGTKSVTIKSLNAAPVAVGTKIQASHDGTGALAAESSAIAVGGTSDTLVIDGYKPTVLPVGSLGDVFRVGSDGFLTLDLDNVSISTGGGTSVPLSSIFQIINGQLCIKLSAPLTDGTTVATGDMTLDTSVLPNVWRPSSTFVGT